MTHRCIISGDHLDRIAWRYNLPIEADAEFKYVTHRGVTFRARLEPVGGAR